MAFGRVLRRWRQYVTGASTDATTRPSRQRSGACRDSVATARLRRTADSYGLDDEAPALKYDAIVFPFRVCRLHDRAKTQLGALAPQPQDASMPTPPPTLSRGHHPQDRDSRG